MIIIVGTHTHTHTHARAQIVGWYGMVLTCSVEEESGEATSAHREAIERATETTINVRLEKRADAGIAISRPRAKAAP